MEQRSRSAPEAILTILTPGMFTRRTAPRSPRPTDLFEPLECRRLLSGDDHPDFIDFPAATSVPVNLVHGQSYLSPLMTGALETEGDTDVFSFVPPVDSTAAVVVAIQSVDGQLAPHIE